MERKEAHYLLMDIKMYQEEEESAPLSPLRVHLFNTDTPISRFQTGQSDLDLYISKPFSRSATLHQCVPHQTLLRFMIDIAAGMDYLSSQGFLHRDLAARNCMLGDDLKVCVADFGLSKKIFSSNYYRQQVAVRMPIKWMAMESLSESIYTAKSDVWSFGVTMWEIVSGGRNPYPGVHNHELLDLLSSGLRLKPPEDCDQKLYEVMYSCWSSDPNLRPNFRDLLGTLEHLLSELPVLEACQEALYINQGLEAADAAGASLDLGMDFGGRLENIYLPSPVGADRNQ
uniref:receptor protein-tyrosine kinase n=1 Tax=Nothobranchius pienaari TaxID=704102 RepID=A0A1A8MG83_9TELE